MQLKPTDRTKKYIISRARIFPVARTNMEELTQFVTKSFENKTREKSFDRKEIQMVEDKKETDPSVMPGGMEVLKCEETVTDLSVVNVEVDVCSSRPQSPQSEKLGFEPGKRYYDRFITLTSKCIDHPRKPHHM